MAGMDWAGTRQPLFIHNTTQLFWAENEKSSVSYRVCRRLNARLQPSGPSTPRSLRAAMNPLLRTVHSGGNVITESSGLETTS